MGVRWSCVWMKERKELWLSIMHFLRVLREVRSLWVKGGEVGGVKGAMEVLVDATGSCIVVF